MPKASGAHIKYAWQQQVNAVINQPNPVSAQWYPVLPTNEDVRIISLTERIIWAVTQPTPLEFRIIIDGVTRIGSFVNPVSAVTYFGVLGQYLAGTNDLELNAAVQTTLYRSFFLEGQSVSIDARITWAVTQPTPLECEVRWARLLPT